MRFLSGLRFRRRAVHGFGVVEYEARADHARKEHADERQKGRPDEDVERAGEALSAKRCAAKLDVGFKVGFEGGVPGRVRGVSGAGFGVVGYGHGFEHGGAYGIERGVFGFDFGFGFGGGSGVSAGPGKSRFGNDGWVIGFKGFEGCGSRAE